MALDFNPSQFADAGKAAADSAFGLTTQALQGVEQLTALNLQVAKTLLAEAAQTTQQALSAKSLEEVLQLHAAALQAAPQKAAAYFRQVQDIVEPLFAAQRAAAEAKVAGVQAQVLDAVDGVLKAAPGSEGAVALVKQALTAANNAYEGVNQASKQFTEAVSANVAKVAEAA